MDEGEGEGESEDEGEGEGEGEGGMFSTSHLRQPGSSMAPGPHRVPSLAARPRSAPWKLMFRSMVLVLMRKPWRCV